THGTAQEVSAQDVQSGVVGDVCEMPPAIAFVERKFGTNEKYVKIAVIVVIQEGAAVADGLQDIQWSRPSNGPGVLDSGAGGDIFKDRCRRARRCCRLSRYEPAAASL